MLRILAAALFALLQGCDNNDRRRSSRGALAWFPSDVAQMIRDMLHELKNPWLTGALIAMIALIILLFNIRISIT